MTDLPTELTPLCTEVELPALLREHCQATGPARFAVCEVLGERVDARVVAWGLDHGNRASLTDADGRPLGWFSSAKTALRLFATDRRMRLVWLDQDS